MARRKSRRTFAFGRFRRRLWPLVIVVALVLVIADQRGWLLVRSDDDLRIYHGVVAPVSRIIDGDTIDIAFPDAQSGDAATRVRLTGIDCPELARFGQPDEALAREARTFAQNMLASQTVRLILDAHQPRDDFGRVLAHVELIDGRSLNEALLEAGLARALDRWPHSRLTRYAQVELVARRREVGMWKKSSR